MSKIQLFNSPEFGAVRALMIDGEPWFVGRDAVTALGYTNAYYFLKNHVSVRNMRVLLKSEIDIPELSTYGLTVINESGLYSLILSSKLPSAKRFKRWITAEVLPALIGSETAASEDAEAVEEPEVFNGNGEQEEEYMNKIQVFSNTEFGKIRTLMIDGEPWFVGKDVASVLGYVDVNKALAMHVDGDDKKLNDKTSLSFGQRGATLINESGLYSLILSSKLPSAKRFKRWITSEVLPTLRKNGTYTLAAAEETAEEPKPKPRATRPLTSDDYIKAADIISRCRNTRLAIAMDLLEKAGLDLPKIPVSTAAAMDEPSAFDTERTRAQMKREMQIMEFVQRKVPCDWSSWSLDRRKKFWQDYENGENDGIELVDRDRICAVEIWQELFGKPSKDLKNINAREINAILAHMAGFEKTKNPVWCGPYKSQRAFIIVEF